MKRFLIVAVAVVLVMGFAGAAFAAKAAQAKGGGMIDGTLSFATEPAGGYGTTIGIGVGVSLDITDRSSFGSKDAKVHIRGDLTYYEWDGSVFGFGISYTRLAAFGGIRYFLPMNGGQSVYPYLEGGLELSYDDAEMAGFFGTASATEISLGLAGGAGLEIPLSGDLVLGVNGRLHLITDSFLTLGASLGVKF